MFQEMKEKVEKLKREVDKLTMEKEQLERVRFSKNFSFTNLQL